jgi:polyisoprenoid-binding protein YceI
MGCGELIQPRLNNDPMTIRSGEYQLDPLHTAILFKVNHLGFSKFVGRLEQATATLNFDPKSAELASLDAIIDMSSVNVNNEKFERTLRNRFWFNAEKFPHARFSTINAKRINDRELDFQGELTFLGRTQPLTLRVTINGAGNNLTNGKYTLGFSAAATLLRSDYGLSLLTPAISDEVELEIHAEFLKQ